PRADLLPPRPERAAVDHLAAHRLAVAARRLPRQPRGRTAASAALSPAGRGDPPADGSVRQRRAGLPLARGRAGFRGRPAPGERAAPGGRLVTARPLACPRPPEPLYVEASALLSAHLTGIGRFVARLLEALVRRVPVRLTT